MKQYERKVDENGQPYLETDLPGLVVMRLPLLNKSTAFSKDERHAFKLLGLYPSYVSSLEEQVGRAYFNYQRFESPLDRHIFLRVLQDRNEVLFYALLEAHLEEMMPIIYTPTVAQAVQMFSQIYRFPRGMVISTENIEHIDDILENTPFPEVKLVVATDSEGILGIGDQGFGGMAICIGKLSLYTAAAGIDPAYTLPIELDVGTNRQDLLDDPLYLGVKHERLTGQAYSEFMERFVTALHKRFPDVLLQWEDFSKQKAFDVLDRYRDTLASFNDDIQGTGAVVLAGLYAAMRKSRGSLSDQIVVIHGAGAGGVGVARRIVAGMVRDGLSEDEARARMFMIDSKGLILKGRAGLDNEPYKREFAQDPARLTGWVPEGDMPTLLETIRFAKATVLIGLSGQRGAFDRDVVQAVDANTAYPIIFPLSNPTDNSEVTPEEVYAWTEGRGIVATGSPFDDVNYGGSRHPVGQGNNAFIFPGLGLGVMLSGAKEVTDGMLTASAVGLADYTDDSRIAQGGMYPRIDRLRGVSKQVAIAVIREAAKSGVATNEVPLDDLDNYVETRMWQPVYLPLRRKDA